MNDWNTRCMRLPQKLPRCSLCLAIWTSKETFLVDGRNHA
jgi:hypothetical protein